MACIAYNTGMSYLTDFRFSPLVTVSLADDGELTLEIDWAQSSEGEWDEDSCEYRPSALAEQVAEALDVWIKSQPERIVIGRMTIKEPATVCYCIEDDCPAPRHEPLPDGAGAGGWVKISEVR